MKKYILYLVLILILIPSRTFANSVIINNLNSSVQIENNGNYNIVENFEFTGGDNNNGIYKNIFYGNSRGIKNLKVFVNNKEIKKVDEAKNGDSNVYTLNDSKENLDFKIYEPWSKNINVTFKYTIEDAAILTKDYGIFSYNFISNLDTPINKFQGSISLNGYDFSDKYVVDGENTSSYLKNNILNIKSENLKNGDFISVNAIITKDLIPYSTNARDITFDDLINKEDSINLNPLIFIPEIFILLIAFLYKRNINRKLSKGETLGHIMPLSPAEASYFLFNANKSTNFILATILNWANKGYFSTSTEEYLTKKNKKRVNYIFTRTDKNIENLSKSEEFLLNNILLKENNYFSTKELNHSRINDTNNFNTKFYKYLSLLNAELIEKGLKSNTFKYAIAGIFVLLFSILFFVLGIMEIMSNIPIAIVAIIISIIIFILSLLIMGTQTALQEEQRDFYNELYKSLEENDKIDECSNMEKETLLIYSIAFGLDYNSISNIQENFGINKDVFLPIFWMTFAGGSTITKEMNKTLVGNENGVSIGGFSSTPGGSGTTGGGSAGGF